MRTKTTLPQLMRVILCLLLGSCAAPLLGQSFTQTISLSPGWNSISLEVTPQDTNVADVFANPAIMSVWTPRVRNSSVAFINNPNAPPFNTAGWMMYLPTNQPASVNNNLYTVSVNTPYLIQVGGSQIVPVMVTGRPSLLALPFTPDGYTLRGFPVDPNNPPSMQTFFLPSPAHYTSPAGPLTSIYYINNGNWEQASGTTPMAPGIGYWVYTTGASSYLAPLATACPSGDGLDFGQSTFELDMKLTNTTAAPMTVTIKDLSQPTPLHPLVYGAVNPVTSSVIWATLTNLTTNVPANGTTLVKFGIQRSQITTGSYATVLSFSDGNGTLLHVPVTAQTSTYPLAGLWVGNISVDHVAEVYNNPTNLTPTASPFVMRAILHVTPNGTTRLLREVIEMEQLATTTTNAGQITTTPPQYALLTDTALLSLPQYTGVVILNGAIVGQRLSTASFDFDEAGGTTNFITMSGTFSTNSTVSTSITLSPTTPTNPFLHRYNPDHNTNTAQQTQVYTVTRQIQFTFTPTDPTGATPTDYGQNEIGGIYNETLIGLNVIPLRVSGTFHLTHTMNVPYLNGSLNQ